MADPTDVVTEKDLAIEVLKELSILDGNDQPTSQDLADVTRRYRQKHAQLEEENVAYWSIDRIPLAAMPGLIRVIAYECASLFRTPYPVENDQRGMYLLRVHSRMRGTNETAKGNFY